jgi:hypothetical protein
VTDPGVAPHDADLQHLLGRPVHGVHRADSRALHRAPPIICRRHCIQSSP